MEDSKHHVATAVEHSIQSPVEGHSESNREPTETDYLLGHNPDLVQTKSPGERKILMSRKTLIKVFTIVVLWFGYLVVSAAYSLFGPFFPGEAAAKGASPTVVGVIVSSSPLCVVFLAPVFGYMLPRLGVRFTLMAGLWLVGGAFVLLGFTDSPQISSGPMFSVFCILLRMTEGVGSAMFFTSVFALLPGIFPDNVGALMGVFEVGSGLGFAIGPPLGGLLYEAGGFSLPFHMMGGLILLFLVPCFFLIENFDSKANTISWTAVKLLGTDFTIIILILVNIFCLAAISFLTPTFQPFLETYFNLSPVYIGLVFFSGPLSYMIFAFVAGPLSDKLGQRGFIMFGQLLYGAAYFFIGPADFISSPHLWITVTAFAVVGCGAAFGMVPIYADILKISKRKSAGKIENETLNSALSGVISSALSLGEFMGPIISGVLTQYLDFQTSALIFGELVLAVTFILIGVTVINKVLQTGTQKP